MQKVWEGGDVFHPVRGLINEWRERVRIASLKERGSKDDSDKSQHGRRVVLTKAQFHRSHMGFRNISRYTDLHGLHYRHKVIGKSYIGTFGGEKLRQDISVGQHGSVLLKCCCAIS